MKLPYRILSLDGGGCWALIQAKALDNLFPNLTGHQILGQFDLAIANSGGSIVLAGLIKNLTPSQILDLFQIQSNRDGIFVRKSFLEYEATKALGVGPRYIAADKLNGLRKIMDSTPNAPVGSLKMSDVTGYIETTSKVIAPQIIIVGFDYDLTREIFFRSKHSSLADPNLAFNPDLASAVHASSNAPINYFDAPAEVVVLSDGTVRRFWDGAIGGFNNPVLQGVAEAIGNNVRAEDIVALSIGTGTVWRPQGPPHQNENLNLFKAPGPQNTINDLKKVADAILDDPPDDASINAHIEMGAPQIPHIVRLSPFVRPVLDNWPAPGGTAWKLPPGFSNFHIPGKAVSPSDGLEAFIYLANLDMDATDQNDITMLIQLAEQWINGTIPNQPIRRNLQTGDCEIGFNTYTDGLKAWRAF